ncbi:MAG: tetratricopeptide repeat protein [Planctomycetota bacterium]
MDRDTEEPKTLPPQRTSLQGLWQLPTFVLGVALFGLGAYLFLAPSATWPVAERLTLIRGLMDANRYGDAIEQLNTTLAEYEMEPLDQAEVHLTLSEALEHGQKQQGIDLPVNHERILDQLAVAEKLGAKLDGQALCRRAESFRALGDTEAAADAFRRAILVGDKSAVATRRTLIDMLVENESVAAAENEIEAYLRTPDLSNQEQAWAYGELSELRAAGGDTAGAKEVLEKAAGLSDDPQVQGLVHLRLGQASFRLGEPKAAERFLRVARDQLGTGADEDADAAYLLGRITLEDGRPAEAVSFFDEVLENHPDTGLEPQTRLRRGVAYMELGQVPAAMSDFERVVSFASARPTHRVLREDALDLLYDAGATATANQDDASALDLLALEKRLLEAGGDKPDGPFFARLAGTLERHAAEIGTVAEEASNPAERIEADQLARRLRKNAGDALMMFARRQTVVDDAASQMALRKAVDMYEAAGATDDAASALELYAVERPSDSATPDVLLRLGQLHQAAGRFNKAANTFRRLREIYPNTLPAAQSAVPLAQSLMAIDDSRLDEAQAVLETVLGNDLLLTPASPTYREALYELSRLYHQRGNYAEAVNHLEQYQQRYADDPRMPRLMYLQADCFRKRAQELESEIEQAQLASASIGGESDADVMAVAPEDSNEQQDRAAKRLEVIGRASDLYRDVIRRYRQRPPTDATDQRVYKQSQFAYADCMYDLGEFKQAIELYNAAAYRYQDDPAALGAYVQIINAHVQLGQTEQARTVNERVKWLVKRMPDDAFVDGGLSREAWMRWFDFAERSGVME